MQDKYIHKPCSIYGRLPRISHYHINQQGLTWLLEAIDMSRSRILFTQTDIFAHVNTKWISFLCMRTHVVVSTFPEAWCPGNHYSISGHYTSSPSHYITIMRLVSTCAILCFLLTCTKFICSMSMIDSHRKTNYFKRTPTDCGTWLVYLWWQCWHVTLCRVQRRKLLFCLHCKLVATVMPNTMIYKLAIVFKDLAFMKICLC
jgi:hypothetical protein